MNMQDFHCEMLELSFRFSSEDFDEDAFLKAAEVDDKEEHIDEDGDFVMNLSFDTRDKDSDYHAHMRILLLKNGKNRIDISYHDSEVEDVEGKPPYAEDCAQWIGTYFKQDRALARISAGYEFDNSFATVISLPFPLISSEKVLAGSLVTGLSIFFPKEKGPETIILQSGSEGVISLFLNSQSEVNLKEFELIKELERLAVSVNSLVTLKKGNDENRKDRK
jgi:hypothetical protein